MRRCSRVVEEEVDVTRNGPINQCQCQDLQCIEICLHLFQTPDRYQRLPASSTSTTSFLFNIFAHPEAARPLASLILRFAPCRIRKLTASRFPSSGALCKTVPRQRSEQTRLTAPSPVSFTREQIKTKQRWAQEWAFPYNEYESLRSKILGKDGWVSHDEYEEAIGVFESHKGDLEILRKRVE